MSKLIISLFVSGCLFAISATSPSIGTIKSTGEFRVDGAAIRGNSTVFDGNVIETEASRSVIDLTGAQITLSCESRVKVFRDRIVLENGSGLVRNAGTHVIEAATLRIASPSNDSMLQIEMSDPTHVAVSADRGDVEEGTRPVCWSLVCGPAWHCRLILKRARLRPLTLPECYVSQQGNFS